MRYVFEYDHTKTNIFCEETISLNDLAKQVFRRINKIILEKEIDINL